MFLDYIKNIFKKKDVVETPHEKDEVDYDFLNGDLNRIILNGQEFNPENLNKDKKTLLIVDDYVEMATLFKNTLQDIKDDYGFDIVNDYNVVMIIGDNCGKDSLTFIENYSVDYAILDITLREIIQKKINGRNSFGAIDGIDIGIEILERYPKCKMIFLTAHNLDTDNEKFSTFHIKYKQYFDADLVDHYINKLDPSRNEGIVNLLRGEDEH